MTLIRNLYSGIALHSPKITHTEKLSSLSLLYVDDENSYLIAWVGESVPVNV